LALFVWPPCWGPIFFAAVAHHRIQDCFLALGAVIAIRGIGWTIAIVLLSLSFAVIYYWAPAVKKRRWHWLTVGGAVGIAGWLLVSLGLRIYLHFFNNYSVTYGSLGAVIILLTWFYITGLMILLGAEINSEIEAAAAEKRLTGKTPPPAATARVAGKRPSWSLFSTNESRDLLAARLH
jgi:membrane protein